MTTVAAHESDVGADCRSCEQDAGYYSGQALRHLCEYHAGVYDERQRQEAARNTTENPDQ